MRILARPVVQTTVVAIMAAFVALILGVTQTLTTAITAAIGLTRHAERSSFRAPVRSTRLR